MKIKYEDVFISEDTPMIVKKVYRHGSDFQSHWHDYYEFVYVDAGRPYLVCENAKTQLNPGDLVLIRPGVLHDTYCSEGNAQLTVIQFYLGCLNVSRQRENYTNRFGVDSAFRPDRFHIKNGGQYASLIGDTVQLLWNEYTVKNSGSDMFIKGGIYTLFGVFVRCGNDDDENEPEDGFDISDITLYIEERIGTGIKLADIAAVKGYSVSYFSRRFKEHTGKSFREYLDNVRLRRARSMLTEQDMPLYEISESLGYGSVQNFCRAYKRITGHKPSEDRHLAKK